MKSGLKKYFKKILWTEDMIQAKCQELAAWIDEEYKDNDNLIVIGLLNGCLPFLFDVLKKVKIILKVDFMKVSSYHGSTKSDGKLKVIMDVHSPLKGKDVLIIDDIIDTALTIVNITRMIKIKNPNSIRVMTLLDKKSGRKTPFKADIYGFDSPDAFLIGYGLDYKNNFRNTPYIGTLDLKYLDNIK